ncbi:MAG: alpha/beta hydrolase [Gammaproteobacteria bacterium]|nr:alpha/beta hydrolase [Gammaproteobacteria bacterium]NNM13211.1 alpha/beta hydrolase [Gammaproteobacteria bacterium]
MPTATINNIELAYEVKGDLDQPVILLIHGLSMSIPAWPPAFLRALRDAGFTLLLFDNRDMGHSQKFTEKGVPNFAWQLLKSKMGLPVKTVYSLKDMSDDACALLEHLQIDKAHVLGVSMGGMIAQQMAIDHPEKLLSLTSIMSTTGKRGLPGPKKEVVTHFMSRPESSSFADRLKFSIRTWELIGSPDYPIDPEVTEMFVKNLLERGMPRDGTARQMLAIAASTKRRKGLEQVDIPSLVIHGKDDPLVRVECGIDTADAIPNARLELVDGMGHDLPQELIPRISNLIVEHVTNVSV